MDLYIFLLLIITVISLTLIAFFYRKHTIPGVKPFMICVLLVALWNGLDAISFILPNLTVKLICFRVKMAFIVYIPSFWLMTIFELTEKRDFRSQSNRWLLILPTITAFISLMFPHNNWFMYNFHLNLADKYARLQFDKGLWFWINASYNYFLNASSFILLLREALSNQYARKRQALIMILGMLIPIISDIMLVGNISLYKNFDLTPISFWLSFIISLYGVFKYKFMNIVLIGREHVFEDMDELMIILDENKKIVDMNTKALQMLSVNITEVINMPIDKLIKDIRKYNLSDCLHSALKIQLTCNFLGQDINYYGSISIIKQNNSHIMGYLLLLQDITELTNTQSKLTEINNELLRLNHELYNDSIKDGLTEVYNKKYITTLLRHEIEDSLKNITPLSICILDIDYFKKFNDNYGHLAGDAVLKGLAELLTSELEGKGTAGRFGGEEFLLLINGNLETAYKLCDKIRLKISNHNFESINTRVTVSMGISELTSSDTVASLIKKADDNLYIAKANGRNRIE